MIDRTEPMHPLAAEYFHGMLLRAGMVPFNLPPKVSWLVASDIWQGLPKSDVPGQIFGAPVFEVPEFPDGMIRLVGAAVDGELNASVMELPL